MTKVQFAYHKGTLSKSLLTLSIFFNIFCFAGKTQTQQYKSTQTELVLSNERKITGSNISYKNALVISRKNSTLTNSNKSEAIALFAYNKLIKVKFDNVSKQYHCFKISDRFSRIKIFSTTSSLDIPHSIIG
jgi:hypothetical protein